ncbi:alcohol oxidase [Mycena galericulata]|nr:alcohol oxidase [Mycena galericulata]
MFMLLSISLWSVFLSGCHAKLYTSVSALPSLSYDFVVVRGGTAGSAVASRLTENPVVLEAGKAGVFESEVPFLFADMLTNPLWSWNFSMTPQPGLVSTPLVVCLGPYNPVDGMFYTRGSAEDYNRYAAVTGDEGWSWNNLLPYFFKNEKWTAPADGHDTRGQFDPAVHSTNGMTLVSLSGFSYPASARVLQTTKELPDEFPFNLDMNSGTPLGVAPRLTVTARKEIILSAGAVGTPSILQHSGVGNKTALTALGLQVLLDLPGVGGAAECDAARRGGGGVECDAHRAVHGDRGVARRVHARCGYAPGEDPAAGPATPHIELTFTEGSLAGLMPGGHFFTIAAEVASPVSRGSVTINSTDPFAPPLIDPGLLVNDTDLHALREAVKMGQRFLTAPVWAGYILSPAEAIAGTTDDAALDAALIAGAMGSSHLVGTASMSAQGSMDGVVDPDLLVKGARGLRVIDASVLPFIPTAHTQAATYVVAERAADLVKAAWA